MRSGIRKELAQRLADEIAEVNASIRRLEVAAEPKEGDCGIGRMLNPDAVPGQAAARETLRLERERLTRLEAAQNRLDDPEFGICLQCRKPIPAERLFLVPEARLCMECKAQRHR